MNNNFRLCYLPKDSNIISEGRILKHKEFKELGFKHKHYYLNENGEKIYNSRKI